MDPTISTVDLTLLAQPLALTGLGFESCRYWRDGLVSCPTHHHGIEGIYLLLFRPSFSLWFVPTGSIDSVFEHLDDLGLDPVQA